MIKIIYLISTILLISNSVCARDQQGDFYISGLGSTSCSQYFETRDEIGYKEINSNWVSGFISAINMFSDNNKSNLLNNMKIENILFSIDQYCETYPSDYLPSALTKIIENLEKE